MIPYEIGKKIILVFININYLTEQEKKEKVDYEGDEL